jgi:hypothetical protein
MRQNVNALRVDTGERCQARLVRTRPRRQFASRLPKGHLGGRIPEQTLLAYDQALEDGAELRECDTAYKFTRDDEATCPYRGTGLVVPMMEEVLDRYPEAPFVIEVKQSDPPIVDHFVEVIREHGVEDNMTGSVFSDAVLAQLRSAAPEIRTNTGVNETLQFWGFSFNELDPEYDPPAEFLKVPTQYDIGDRVVDVMHPGFVPRARDWLRTGFVAAVTNAVIRVGRRLRGIDVGATLAVSLRPARSAEALARGVAIRDLDWTAFHIEHAGCRAACTARARGAATAARAGHAAGTHTPVVLRAVGFGDPPIRAGFGYRTECVLAVRRVQAGSNYVALRTRHSDDPEQQPNQDRGRFHASNAKSFHLVRSTVFPRPKVHGTGA